MSAVLLLDDGLHVGQVVLEPLAFDGIDDAPGDLLRCLLGPVVERRVVIGLVPDFRVDGTGEDQLHRDARPVEVDGHRLAPPRQRELRTRVGGLGGDAQAAAEARHVDDRPGTPLEHAGQEGQRDRHRGEVVDAHRPFDLGHAQARDGAAHRDGGVVDDDVEPVVVVPDPARQVRRGLRVGEVGGPARGGGRGGAAVGQHLVEAIGPPGHQRHRVSPLGESVGEGGADARGCTGDQHRPARCAALTLEPPPALSSRVCRGPPITGTAALRGERGVSNPRPPGPQPGALTN